MESTNVETLKLSPNEGVAECWKKIDLEKLRRVIS